LIILSSELKKNYIGEIKLKTLYASKYDNLKEIKKKIKRCYKFITEKNMQNNKDYNNNNKDFNLFHMFNVKEKEKGKRFLINLIYHYKINAKKFRIPGKFLMENEDYIEVKFFQE
jgi:hypothetical protein